MTRHLLSRAPYLLLLSGAGCQDAKCQLEALDKKHAEEMNDLRDKLKVRLLWTVRAERAASWRFFFFLCVDLAVTRFAGGCLRHWVPTVARGPADEPLVLSHSCFVCPECRRDHHMQQGTVDDIFSAVLCRFAYAEKRYSTHGIVAYNAVCVSASAGNVRPYLTKTMNRVVLCGRTVRLLQPHSAVTRSRWRLRCSLCRLFWDKKK